MFQIKRGTTKTYTIEVRKAGVLVSLAGARIYFTVRNGLGSVVLAKANTAGGGSDAQIEVTAIGTFKLKLTHADTDREPMIGACDGFVVTSADEYVDAIAGQSFQILQAQTRAFPT